VFSGSTRSTFKGIARECSKTVMGEAVWRGGMNAAEPLGHVGPVTVFDSSVCRHVMHGTATPRTAYFRHPGWLVAHVHLGHVLAEVFTACWAWGSLQGFGITE